MDIGAALEQIDDGAGIDALARKFGLSREQAEAAIAGVLPEIARRLERNTLSRGGVADLVAMLGTVDAANQAGGVATTIGSDAGRDSGNQLLEQIFGGRDASRAVAARASLGSGISEMIIKAMLPYIASMVMGSLSRRMGGGLGDILSKVPNIGGGGLGGNAPSPTGRGGSGGFGAPGPASGPLAFPTGGGGMLPGPEGMQAPGRNPYGDLSDVIRRGGGAARVDGSPLWRIVRNVFGAALGFQSRGIMGWIVRAIVMRYGWTLARTILGRLFRFR